MDLSCIHRTVTVGAINHRSGTLAERVVDGVAHHASDHIAPAAKCDMPANRLTIVQKTMNEFFVDDGLLRSGKVVEVCEIPSRAERNCHQPEITRGHDVGQSPARRGITARVALHRNRRQWSAVKIKRHGGRNGRCFDGRQSAHALQ